jgi:hypothetical protein
VLIAEIGPDMTRCPAVGHLISNHPQSEPHGPVWLARVSSCIT